MGGGLVHLGRDHVEGDQDLELVLRRESTQEALNTLAFHRLVAVQKESEQEHERYRAKGKDNGLPGRVSARLAMRRLAVARLDIVDACRNVGPIAKTAERARERAPARLTAPTQTARRVTVEGVWASANVNRVTGGPVVAGADGQQAKLHPWPNAVCADWTCHTAHAAGGVCVIVARPTAAAGDVSSSSTSGRGLQRARETLCLILGPGVRVVEASSALDQPATSAPVSGETGRAVGGIRQSGGSAIEASRAGECGRRSLRAVGVWWAHFASECALLILVGAGIANIACPLPLLSIVRARRAERRVLAPHGTEGAVPAGNAVLCACHHLQRQVLPRAGKAGQRRRRALGTVVTRRTDEASCRALHRLEGVSMGEVGQDGTGVGRGGAMWDDVARCGLVQCSVVWYNEV